MSKEKDHGHKHFGCPECQAIVHDEKGEYTEGDSCPNCFSGKLVEAHELPSPEEMAAKMQAPMLAYMKEVEAARDERSIKQHEEMKAIATRTMEALESQAQTSLDNAARNAKLVDKMMALAEKYLNPPEVSSYPTPGIEFDAEAWKKQAEEEAERRRQGRELRMATNSKAVAAQERQAVALEEIADHLGAVVSADDSGRPALHITGELVGGEGDVTAGK